MRSVSRLGRSIGLAPLALGILALGLATPAAASDRVELRGSVPAYADSQAPAGQVPANRRLSFQVVLGFRRPAAATALAKRVSDPTSDSYRHFVSAGEFRRRFSWRRRQIRPVARWLRNRGMSVRSPTRNGVLLPAAGTAAEFERAFGTRLGRYRAYGQELVAPRSQLSVPRSLSRMVQGTIGVPEVPLSPDFVGAMPGELGASATTAGDRTTDPGPPPLGFDGIVANQPPPPHCSPFWAAETGSDLPPAYGQLPLLSICGYRAKQIRSAYGAQKLYRNGIDGSGIDIGIVTAYVSPTLQSDLDEYSDKNGIPRTRLRITRSSYTPANPNTIWDDYTEQTLDVQVSHGMAPRATIHYAGPNGLNNAIMANTRMVDQNQVDVISNSWGGPETLLPDGSYVRSAEDTFKQAAAQGITVIYSSGDFGDSIARFGIRNVQFPSSSPWVTGVGGTTLAVGPTHERVAEQAWGEAVTLLDQTTGAWNPDPPGTYAGGSTGGTSRLFPQPGYQREKVPRSYFSYFGGRARVVPDIGLIGDPMSGPGLVQTAVDPTTGAEVVTHHNVGGTSVAAPVFAGLVAVMADRNGGRLGFLNPSLYRVGQRALRRVGPARVPAVSAQVIYNNFLDASDGYKTGLISGGQYGTLTVRKGYDDITGLGSPSIPTLAKRLRRMSG
jgi:subtilase family serine protease